MNQMQQLRDNLMQSFHSTFRLDEVRKGIYQVFIASKGNKQNFHIIQLLAPLLFPLPLQLQIPEGL